ncbi:hypothetical protein KEM52_003985 [Ascosphaera acerosa]|nr:hypothetical protein KEM52_003985 [Ascosphaera acerosa]
MGKIRQLFRRGKEKRRCEARDAYLRYGQVAQQGCAWPGVPPLPDDAGSPLRVPGPRDRAARLPPEVLDHIFSRVCAHATDGSYRSCEESMPKDTCMSCDLRDLANCALVCRGWRTPANRLLYTNIRIDAVHYCELEIVLSDLRRKGTFDKNREELDAPLVRLELLCRTLRGTQELANQVRTWS